ncbi:MAG: Bax inhibitor-1/YccA family protein [Alphaproteobacteria bacterium]|nr:Bax inhibitor-1/YccA family protein [Alphaproteobacteria bacterium]
MIESREFASYSNSEVIDQGLRNYMLKIYNYMAGGLTATALVAYFVITNPSIFRLFFNEMGYTGFGYLALVAPLVLIFAFSWVLQRGTVSQVKSMFWGYSALMGISLAPIFLIYTGTSIARVFLITAATFGALSIYGYTTKKDLTAWGGFLFMGVIGIVIASIVNMFMNSHAMGYAISYITVFIFAGLTAYDTQNLKSIYYANNVTEDGENRGAIAGALSLYLDFINMFMALLRLFGDRR